MKRQLVFLPLILVALFFLAAKTASAVVTFNHCCKIDCQRLSRNPKIVACYESGTHGIVGQSETHTGADYVKKLGNFNLFQFFCGTSPSEGLHREVSLWKLARDKQCPSGWILLEKPFPAWGDYLKPEADYCVKTITLPCPKCGCRLGCPLPSEAQ
jgi:hypothetical protein